MGEDGHLLLQFTFLSPRCAVRHKSDLNLNTLYAFCLYQEGSQTVKEPSGMATVKEPRCVVLFHGRAATYRVQLPEVDSSSSLALSLNIKAGALSRGTERDRHAEEGTVGASGMTTHSELFGRILFIASRRYKALHGRD